MKPKTMILIVLAVTCGLGASWMTRQVLMGRQVEDKETVEILVAKRHLSVGQRMVKPEELFERKTILKENDTPDAIREFDKLTGKILKQGRNAGDTVVPTNLFSEKEQIEIPAGYRALGLKVNLETSASGLASLPYSRVDLIWFQRGRDNQDSRVDVLLQNVLVLAADGKIDRDGLTAVAQVVILALTPEEVLKVNMAKETGILNLSLRNLGEDKLTFTPGFTGEQMRTNGHNGDKSVPVVDQPQAPAVVVAKLSPSEPHVKAKGIEAPETKPAVEEPKTFSQTLTIVNGTETGNRIVTQVPYHTNEDGQVVEPPSRPADVVPAGPAPAAPKKSVQRDDM